MEKNTGTTRRSEEIERRAAFENKAVEWSLKSADPPGFEVVDYGSEKGRGAVAAREFVQGEYLLTYHGTRIRTPQTSPDNNEFVYDFVHNGEKCKFTI
jgi:hypothetical protein